MLAYKQPFKAPHKIVFDLQTFEQTEELPIELEEVTTGIEAGVCKFLDALIEPGANVGHLVLGKRSFGLRTSLNQKLQDLGAKTFYLID